MTNFVDLAPGLLSGPPLVKEVTPAEVLERWTPNPRVLVELGGQWMPWSDVHTVEVETNVAWEADTLTAVFDNTNLQSDYLRKEMAVRVYVGRVPDPDAWTKSDLVKMFDGEVDGVIPHFGAQRTVEIRARDLTRRFIDVEFTGGIQNSTASEIAHLFARKAHMSFDIQDTDRDVAVQNTKKKPSSSAATDPAIQTTRRTVDLETFKKKTKWEILQMLAIREGFVCYVDSNRRLHFHPRRETDTPIGTWAYLQPPFNILSFEADDSSIGIPNKIIVLRWIDDVTGLVQGEFQDDARVAAAGGRIIERTIYSKVAQNGDECKTEAEAYLKSKVRDTITATLQVQGDPRMVPEVVVKVVGELGRFQGTYYINRVTHALDAQNGYTARVALSNIRPEASEVYRESIKEDDPENAVLTPGEIAGVDPGLVTGGDISNTVGTLITACGVEWEIQFPFNAPYSNPWSANIPNHRGVDLIIHGAANHGMGQPVKAFQPGVVVAAGPMSWPSGHGVIATIDGTDLHQAYFHMSSVNVSAGQKIEACQQIGILGEGGTEGNPHLHFEVRKGVNGDPQGSMINPLPYMGATRGTATSAGSNATSTVKPEGSTGVVTVPANYATYRQLLASGDPDHHQLAQSIAKWWPQSEWENAARISQAESGWHRTSRNGTAVPGRPEYIGPCGTPYRLPNGLRAQTEDSVGMFQMNRCAHGHSVEELEDVEFNCSVAFQLWRGLGRWGSTAGWATAEGLGIR